MEKGARQTEFLKIVQILLLFHDFLDIQNMNRMFSTKVKFLKL